MRKILNFKPVILMLKCNKIVCVILIVFLAITLMLPVIAQDELDNAQEQQKTVFWVQVIGGSVIAVIIISLLIKNRNIIMKNPSKITVMIDEDKVIDKIRFDDPDFNRENFRDYAGKTILAILSAFSKRDSALLRLYESSVLFSIHDKQIREAIESKRTYHKDDIALHSVEIADFNKNVDNVKITVRAVVSMLEYTTDDTSGEILEGSRIVKRNRSYKFDFIRSPGAKSSENFGSSKVCPVCTKPLNITLTGKCIECKTLLCDGSYGWVLNSYSKWGYET